MELFVGGPCHIYLHKSTAEPVFWYWGGSEFIEWKTKVQDIVALILVHLVHGLPSWALAFQCRPTWSHCPRKGHAHYIEPGLLWTRTRGASSSCGARWVSPFAQTKEGKWRPNSKSSFSFIISFSLTEVEIRPMSVGSSVALVFNKAPEAGPWGPMSAPRVHSLDPSHTTVSPAPSLICITHSPETGKLSPIKHLGPICQVS